MSRGSADFLLPPKTEAVSASRKTHTIAQTSLSRGTEYPTSTRIEAGSFSQKAQIRRAVHPFSTIVPTVVQKMLSDPPHQYGAASHQPQRLEHPHSAVGQPPKYSMFVSVDSPENSGSARSRLPYGVSLSRNRTECMVQKWHAEKQKLQKYDLDAQDREDVLYKLAHICTTMMRDNRGVVGDVARAVGGSLVAPPIDPTHIQR